MRKSNFGFYFTVTRGRARRRQRLRHFSVVLQAARGLGDIAALSTATATSLGRAAPRIELVHLEGVGWVEVLRELEVDAGVLRAIIYAFYYGCLYRNYFPC